MSGVVNALCLYLIGSEVQSPFQMTSRERVPILSQKIMEAALFGTFILKGGSDQSKSWSVLSDTERDVCGHLNQAVSLWTYQWL